MTVKVIIKRDDNSEHKTEIVRGETVLVEDFKDGDTWEGYVWKDGEISIREKKE